MKECKKCKEVKPPTDFYKNCSHSDGLDSICKVCRKAKSKDWYHDNRERKLEHHRNRTYGISTEWYEDKLKQQDFRCAGCHTHQKDLEYSLCVDHCHTTDKPRGLLCKPCNLALGNADDNPDTLRRLAQYAEETRQT